VSPFFAIVKPTIAAGFDYRTLQWDPPGLSAEDLREAVHSSANLFLSFPPELAPQRLRVLASNERA
jgi:hypothetical protein